MQKCAMLATFYYFVSILDIFVVADCMILWVNHKDSLLI